VVTPIGTQLEPGVWTNVSPLDAYVDAAINIAFVTLDPCNPSLLYACVGENGLWKSPDGGATWSKLGNGVVGEDDTTGHLDNPTRVAIDPADPRHLYATQGVLGDTLGFWVSHDGGETWKRPPGFADVSPTFDVTFMAVDPGDFAHVIVASHSDDGVFLESRDGGETWKLHQPPEPGITGSFSVHFLHHPQSGRGNGDTWLTQLGTLWRTEDAGATWESVGGPEGTHEAANLHYTAEGVLYVGGFGTVARSTDNGLTWQNLDAVLPYAAYNAIGGDGTTLYVKPSGEEPGPWFTSPESDGTIWTEQTEQLRPFTPYSIAFDPVHGVLYAGQWSEGVQALATKH
jgi:photosystem II stability/assembly factor-like uncharacterized protein